MVENGDDKQRIENAEMNVTSKKLWKGLIALLDKQSWEIHDQDKIIDRIEEFYTELCDCGQSTITHTDSNEVPSIKAWEMEAAL